MTFIWPLEGGRESYPITNDSDGHISDGGEAACDFACEVGVPCLAIAQGNVTRSGVAGSCGLSVDLEFDAAGGSYLARYCHLSESYGTGYTMEGSFLGRTGGDPSDPNAGQSTGPHLHLALWRDGQRVRPEDYLIPAPESDDTTKETEVDTEKLLAALDIVWQVKGLLEGTKRLTRGNRDGMGAALLAAVIAAKEATGLQ